MRLGVRSRNIIMWAEFIALNLGLKTHVVRAAVQCKAGVPRPTTQLASWLREDRVDIDSRSDGEISALYRGGVSEA